MNGYLFDTHAWVWTIQEATAEVSPSFFAQAEEWQRQGLAYLSPYSCWELGMLDAAGRLNLDAPIEFLWERDTADGFHIAELTPHILIESNRLPGEIHRDPADRILAATARAYGLTLVTRDKALLQYGKQGHIRARKP